MIEVRAHNGAGSTEPERDAIAVDGGRGLFARRMAGKAGAYLRWLSSPGGQRIRVGFAAVAAFLILWELNRWVDLVSPFLVASPTIIAESLPRVLDDGLISVHGRASLLALVIGFIPAVVLGTLVGAALGYWRRLKYLFEPVVMVFYMTPRIALIPILIMWLGIGTASKVAVVFLGGVFPIIINTMSGVEGVDRLWIRTGSSFGASRFQTVFRIIVPGAVPSIMTGVRLGFGRSLIGVIIAEMYVAIAGMGKMMRNYQNSVSLDALFVVVLAVTVFGFLGVQLLNWAERKLSPWSEDVKW